MKFILSLLVSLFIFSTVTAQTSLSASVAKAKAEPVNLKSEGFWRPYGPATAISTGVCVAGVGFDLATSGGRELNPLLRNSDGNINKGRAAAIGFGICGVSFLFERKYPKFAHFLRFASGGGHLMIAMRNQGVK